MLVPHIIRYCRKPNVNVENALMAHDIVHKPLHIPEIVGCCKESKIVAPHIEDIIVPVMVRPSSKVLHKRFRFFMPAAKLNEQPQVYNNINTETTEKGKRKKGNKKKRKRNKGNRINKYCITLQTNYIVRTSFGR